jgi:hypothetical protein
LLQIRKELNEYGVVPRYTACILGYFKKKLRIARDQNGMHGAGQIVQNLDDTIPVYGLEEQSIKTSFIPDFPSITPTK